jgi:DNA-binding transcriptional regulator YiaG
MRRNERSKTLEAVQMTMRHFDRLCLEPVRPLRPAEIKRIRESLWHPDTKNVRTA